MLIVSTQVDSKETPEKLDPFGQFQVARETGSELCRTALWECFGTLSLLLVAIFTETVMPLVYPPQFCITIVFNFSWDDCNTQEKLETMVMQKFGG